MSQGHIVINVSFRESGTAPRNLKQDEGTAVRVNFWYEGADEYSHQNDLAAGAVVCRADRPRDLDPTAGVDAEFCAARARRRGDLDEAHRQCARHESRESGIVHL